MSRIVLFLATLLLGSSVSARSDIVFLMPQEGHGSSEFFDYAGDYYRQQSGVVLVVDSARSLLQVREFLQRSPLREGQPWGRIILVAHGSRWTGLSVPIFDDEGVAPPRRWREVLTRGEFIPLSADVIDADTRLIVESCGLGTRTDLLRALSQMLSGDLNLLVEAAEGLVEFRRAAAGKSSAGRRERNYGAHIQPRRRALEGVQVDAAGRRLLPVEFKQPLLATRDCRSAKLAGLLRPNTPMGQTLSDYGLRPRDLYFDLQDSGTGCELRGRGVLVIEADIADWPMVPIASAVSPPRN
jgi:hypothetical protein